MRVPPRSPRIAGPGWTRVETARETWPWATTIGLTQDRLSLGRMARRRSARYGGEVHINRCARPRRSLTRAACARRSGWWNPAGASPSCPAQPEPGGQTGLYRPAGGAHSACRAPGTPRRPGLWRRIGYLLDVKALIGLPEARVVTGQVARCPSVFWRLPDVAAPRSRAEWVWRLRVTLGKRVPGEPECVCWGRFLGLRAPGRSWRRMPRTSRRAVARPFRWLRRLPPPATGRPWSCSAARPTGAARPTPSTTWGARSS
jgi:hypothetical protein